ncbi:MAG: M20 family metallopeptidase, partial [Chloroflexi bacterium]
MADPTDSPSASTASSPDSPSAPGPLVSGAELEALRRLVGAAEPEFLDELAALVNIDCGSYTKAGVDEVGRRTRAFLERIGARVEVHRHDALGDTVVGTFDGTPNGPRLMLVGHMDTVFDVGTAAARPFRIEGGRAYGPGVTDMKSGLLAGLHALQALRDLRGDGPGPWLPFERLTFIANPDEEIGSPSSTPIIREVAGDADACLVLECARENGDIVSSRKGILDAQLVVHGRAAHAGVEPEKGRSAILAAAQLVPALHGLTGRWPGVTCNVGVIRGGTRPNVVAEEARLEVDLRAITRPDLEAAEAEVRALIARPAVPDVTIDLEPMAR